MTKPPFNYYLPSIKSPSITIPFLLDLGNDKYFVIKNNEVKKCPSNLLKGMSKASIFLEI